MKPRRTPVGEGPASLAEEPFDGWLARAVRMPVRIVTLLLIVPVRLVWDAVTACGRALRRVVWVPFARASEWVWRKLLSPVLFALLVWPWLALWRYVLAPTGRALAWLAKAAGAGIAWSGQGLWAVLAWLGRHLVVEPLSLLHRYVLAPLGRGVLAVARAVGAGLAWFGRTMIGAPLGFLYRHVLKPVGFAVLAVMAGVGVASVWLWRYLVVAPCRLLHRYVLRPAWQGVVAVVRGTGWGLAWLWRWLVVLPCTFVHRKVLRPTGRAVAVVAREIADAVAHAWRVAGYVSRAVFRFIGRVLRFLFVDPAVWTWQYVVRPMGRGLRDAVWRPAAKVVREVRRGVRASFTSALASARASVRETRAELRRALFGGPPARKRESDPLAEPASGPGPHRRVLSERGRVPWVAGSPHNSATPPGTLGAKRDDADFRTL